MKIIGYARVSSKEQAQNSHALEQQIERLKQAGAEEVLADVESGWKNESDRTNLKQLMLLVENRQVDQVLVTRLDRLSRRGLKSFQIIEKFLKSNVTLKALDESFDLTTAAGRAMAGQLVVFAQFHSDQKAESIRHGWEHLRSKKVAIQPPFGYKVIDGKYELNHEPFLCLIDGHIEFTYAAIAHDLVNIFFEQQTLRKTLAHINQKYGIQFFSHCSKSGKKLNGRSGRMFRFSLMGFRNWLLNPVLQGHTAYRKQAEIYYNTHLEHRIISPDEFSEIEKIFKQNKAIRGYGTNARRKYPCSGLVFCADCRGACYSATGTRNYYRAKRLGIPIEKIYYFQCKNWRIRGCSQKTMIPMQTVEDAIITSLTQKASKIVAGKMNFTATVVKSEKLLQLESQLKGLQQLGKNPAIDEAIANLQLQIEAEVSQHQQASQNSQEVEKRRKLCAEVFSDSQFWLQLTDEDKRRIYRELVDKVLVRDGKVVSVSLAF